MKFTDSKLANISSKDIVSSLSDEDIYDLIMSDVFDYTSLPVTTENNPDFLIVLGCSPAPLKARVVKMLHLFQKGYGKYILFSGGLGWQKLFVPTKKDFSSNDERFEYFRQKAIKKNQMKLALQKTIPDEIKGPHKAKHGVGLYKYMHRMLEKNLNETEANIAYKIMKASKSILEIDDDKIFFEDKSKNTNQNLQFSRELIDSLKGSGKITDIHKLMIITSCYHCRRAVLSFKKFFPEYDVLSCPSTLDIAESGMDFNKDNLIHNKYYMTNFKNELKGIIDYSRNGSIANVDIEELLNPLNNPNKTEWASNRANEIVSKILEHEHEF